MLFILFTTITKYQHKRKWYTEMVFENGLQNARPQYQFYQNLKAFQDSDMFKLPAILFFIKLYVHKSVFFLKVQLILLYFHSKRLLQ